MVICAVDNVVKQTINALEIMTHFGAEITWRKMGLWDL
jgi:hypothetical protein